MDSNAFVGNAGVGEREARVSATSCERHWPRTRYGTLGDAGEEQPATGSSLLAHLTNASRPCATRRCLRCVRMPRASSCDRHDVTLAVPRQLRP